MFEILPEDVGNYIGRDRTRVYREGKLIINANYLSNLKVVKISGKESEKREITALCIKSSEIYAKPHTLTVRLSKSMKNAAPLDISGLCSCKGGADGRCKHLCALLIYLERLDDIDNLESASCTDVQCAWSTSKAKDIYAPIAIEEYCHIRRRKRMYPSLTDKCERSFKTQVHVDNVTAIINEGSDDGAFLKTKVGRGTAREVQDIIHSQTEIKKRLNTEEIKKLLEYFEEDIYNLKPSIRFLNEDLKTFYESAIELTQQRASFIYENTQEQAKDQLWKDERKVRITGSKAHELFTYSRNKKPDWVKKLDRIYFTDFHPTADMMYGITHESEALKLFESTIQDGEKIIDQTGLMVNTLYPWFAFSPDGILQKSDGTLVLLEVKCPKLGKTLTLSDLSDQLKYLVKGGEGSIKLNDKHQYYTQIQFSLAVSGMRHAILIILCEKNNCTLNIDVPYNEISAQNLLHQLTATYFNHVLPFIHQRIISHS